MAWYRNGTIALTQGAVEVIGTGTKWIGNVVPGSILIVEADPIAFVEVLSVNAHTRLTLAKPYDGATATGVSYAAAPTQSYLPEVAQGIAELMTAFGDIKAAWNAGALISPVTSVGGKTGAVTKADLALDKVNNTADADKPISAAQQAALDLKAPKNNPTFTGTVSGITKSMVGLGNANNTSDADKPVSVAQQAALDLKAPSANPTFTGAVSGITKAMVGLANVNNTADVDKPISTAQQAALDLKAPLDSPTFTGTVSGVTKSMVGLGNVNNTSDADKPVSIAAQALFDALTSSAQKENKVDNGAMAVGIRPATSVASGWFNIVDRWHSYTSGYQFNAGVVWRTAVGSTTPRMWAALSPKTAVPDATFTTGTGKSVHGFLQPVERVNCIGMDVNVSTVSFKLEAFRAGKYAVVMRTTNTNGTVIAACVKLVDCVVGINNCTVQFPEVPTTYYTGEVSAALGLDLMIAPLASPEFCVSDANLGVWVSGDYRSSQQCVNWCNVAGTGPLLTEVQWSYGTNATYQHEPFPLTLLRCQRHYNAIGQSISIIQMQSGLGLTYEAHWSFPARMRATPAIAQTFSNIRNVTSYGPNASVHGVSLYALAATSGSIGSDYVAVTWTSLIANSELR